jgi:hypothetical protein
MRHPIENGRMHVFRWYERPVRPRLFIIDRQFGTGIEQETFGPFVQAHSREVGNPAGQVRYFYFLCTNVSYYKSWLCPIRFYIHFIDAKAADVGFNGETFEGKM